MAVLPTLIACDLDGTLLDPSGALTDRTATALQAMADAGVIVVFATGRPPFAASVEVGRAGRGVHYGVMANGTMICRLPDAEVLRTLSFGAGLARRTVAALRAHDPDLAFAMATDRGFTAEPGFHERMPVLYESGPTVDDALVGHEDATEAIKLIAFHPRHAAHDLVHLLQPVVGEEMLVSHMGADAVEIAPAGADKGQGLHWLCEHLGVPPAEVLVFGDEINDLPMFRWAGRRVAVENAHPTVKELADEVTAPNGADGVAQYLERLLASHRP